ncbi:two-component regulator propeller domain-containing protein [Lysobacter sp. N42]|uniref:two-component regulator propeller domain-containing protein n=1 Tax=Lysobacter sp. N42 TaxID=2545719 RepID=UPI00104CDFE7|nr:two-component regulator propeller domain-containing protein [Lysobacter sp. N42]TCZ86020.1 hybrid sensor histidine kinase/response regulator [Lysobacter sp. N42]
MRALIVAALAALIAFAPAASAGLPETPRPRQFTVADGLPSNRINAIAQDRRGYLWIATSDGLARFDGVGFRVWRAEQGLRDNFVWSVHVDAQDRVWIGTRTAGLAMLDVDRRRFVWIDRGTPGVGGNEVWSIASTRDGALWFGTADAGLHRLVRGRVRRYVPMPGNERSLPDPGVRQLAVAPDGSLWVGTGHGVARFDGQGFERMPSESLASPLINGLSVERDGTLWIGTPRGVAVRRPDGRGEPAPWAHTGRPVLHVLMRDRAGSYWFDIPEGLGIDVEDRVTTVPLYSELAQGLVRPSWVDAHEDREGGLWFASNSSGLWYLPPRWRQFSVLARRLGDSSTLANAQVRGIAPSRDGTVWLVGSGGVLDRLDSESGEVEHVVEDVGDGFILHAALEDRRGQVWVTFTEGLARVDPRTGEVRRWWPGQHNGAMPGDASRLVQAADGSIWIAGEYGVQVRDEDGRVIARYMRGDGRGLDRATSVHDIAPSLDGGMWIATSDGLLAPDARGERLVRVPGVDAGPVHGIAVDTRGGLWLARFGAVEGYDLRRGRPVRRERLGPEAGFPRLAPTGLTVDDRGIVWVTSVRGLVRVDPAARSSRVYGVRDGLPSQEFADPPVARPSDGRILAGTPEGLVLFDPAVVRPATEAPGLVLETVDVLRNGVRVPLDPARPFSLAPGDRDLRIRARMLAFADPSAHVYRTRLLGYDAAWVDGGTQGERVFSQLPPGDYRLQLTARTADHVWAPVRELRFSVSPPWWRAWWSITGFALTGLAALALLAAYYRGRLRRRHAWEQAEHERRLAQEASVAKTRFLATFGHEVRTPMTGVLGMSELLLDTPLDARQRSHVAAIRSAGEHLLRLLNDALDLARIESGRLELVDEVFDLRALLADLSALLGPLAERRGLRFELDLGPDLPAGVRGDASRLKQVLLNLLNNALKFTEQGHVSLHVRRVGDRVRFVVQDTGPGLSAEQRARLFRRFEQGDGARTAARHGGSGLGLAISHELVDAMGGRIDVDSTPGVGTRFEVEVPLPAAALPARAPQADVAARPPAALSILLVEDDATVAEVITGLLRAQGHEVRHAPHGLAALAEAQMRPFDVGLLDLDLPGMDGFALARQLRAGGCTVPLVAVTARADAESEPQARAAGFDRFMRKPVTGAMLANVLQDVLHGEPA